jgi:hypothetical protein
MGKTQAGEVWNAADLMIFSLDAHMFKPHFYVATHLGKKKNKERERERERERVTNLKFSLIFNTKLHAHTYNDEESERRE